MTCMPLGHSFTGYIRERGMLTRNEWTNIHNEQNKRESNLEGNPNRKPFEWKDEMKDGTRKRQVSSSAISLGLVYIVRENSSIFNREEETNVIYFAIVQQEIQKDILK